MGLGWRELVVVWLGDVLQYVGDARWRWDWTMVIRTARGCGLRYGDREVFCPAHTLDVDPFVLICTCVRMCDLNEHH